MQKFESERIQKVLAQLGVASRRTIESWIVAGRITVNGKHATIGQKIGPHDKIKVNGRPVMLRRLETMKTRVLIFYKPEGLVCSHEPMESCPTVFSALPPAKEGKWIMIGRLDVNSTGLLLFTNNGQLAHGMMHPRFQLPRQYLVRSIGHLTDANLEKMKAGIRFEEGLFKFDDIAPHPRKEGSNQWYTVTLHQGHYREVRRLFESQGATVNRLTRVQFGDISLPKRLARGRYQIMSEDETEQLVERYVTHQSSEDVVEATTL